MPAKHLFRWARRPGQCRSIGRSAVGGAAGSSGLRRRCDPSVDVLIRGSFRSLGLGPFDRLDPVALADEHGIPVYPLHELADCPEAEAAVEHFATVRKSVWSAALLPQGPARIILVNDAHLLVRRVSSIAHELGHHLLEHEFDSVLLTEEKKCRQFDATKEKEAKFLSGELLLPRRAAQKAAFAGKTNEEIAERFGVSTQFAQMQMAGARIFAQRALQRQN